MNTVFYNTIRDIISEQGEAILGDPQRLKGFVADWACDVPKEERFAFGRCIEYGFYGELKKVFSEKERAGLRQIMAQKLQQGTGLEESLCTDALDLLESVIFKKKIRLYTNDGCIIDRSAQSYSLIIDEFDRLEPDESNLLLLEQTDEFDGNVYLTVKLSDAKTYILETRVECTDKFNVYRYITSDRDEAASTIEEYFLKGIIPGIANWKDITYEYLNNMENETIDERANENARDLLSNSDDDIIRDMADFFHANSQDKYDLETAPYEMFRKYYESKGISNIKQISREFFERLSWFYQKALNIYYREREEALVKKVLSLVGECISWKPHNRKFTKAEIDMFLYEKKLKVHGHIRDMFYLKVNDTLQEAGK